VRRNGRRRKTGSRRRNSGRNGRSRVKKSGSSGTTRTTSGPRKRIAKRTRNRSGSRSNFPGGKVKNKRKTGSAKLSGFLRKPTSGAPGSGKKSGRKMFRTG
jgi:hypothetical protein